MKLARLSQKPFPGILPKNSKCFDRKQSVSNTKEKNIFIYEVFYWRTIPNTKDKHPMKQGDSVMAQKIYC